MGAFTRPQIAVIDGSLSRASINRRLARALMRQGGDRFTLLGSRIDDLPYTTENLTAHCRTR